MRLRGEDRRQLRTSVESLVADLGPTADTIAERLGDLGVRGRPGDEHRCVLNSYLSLVVGADPMVVGVAVRPHAVHVRVHRFGPSVRVPLPVEARAFISAFDAGIHPHLVVQNGLERSEIVTRGQKGQTGSLEVPGR